MQKPYADDAGQTLCEAKPADDGRKGGFSRQVLRASSFMRGPRKRESAAPAPPTSERPNRLHAGSRAVSFARFKNRPKSQPAGVDAEGAHVGVPTGRPGPDSPDSVVTEMIEPEPRTASGDYFDLEGDSWMAALPPAHVAAVALPEVPRAPTQRRIHFDSDGDAARQVAPRTPPLEAMTPEAAAERRKLKSNLEAKYLEAMRLRQEMEREAIEAARKEADLRRRLELSWGSEFVAAIVETRRDAERERNAASSFVGGLRAARSSKGAEDLAPHSTEPTIARAYCPVVYPSAPVAVGAAASPALPSSLTSLRGVPEAPGALRTVESAERAKAEDAEAQVAMTAEVVATEKTVAKEKPAVTPTEGVAAKPAKAEPSVTEMAKGDRVTLQIRVLGSRSVDLSIRVNTKDVTRVATEVMMMQGHVAHPSPPPPARAPADDERGNTEHELKPRAAQSLWAIVRALRLAEPDLGVKPMLARLRREGHTIEGAKELREMLRSV